ncbi:MAG TPA: c-type cytochrome [Candidatus Methylomirabilis sp.]|nr:c-type cytochrome [Candidatus Methylomirabilis sp.]
MGIARPGVIVSTVLAAVLIGILAGFQIPVAKSATTPNPAPPQSEGGASHGAAPAGHGASPMKADPVVQRGQQLFGQYCSGCHGPEGKGDGISGQNLPIKPQDLTVGAQLNPLPDRFLFEVIAHGAQSVGLSPLMPGFTPFLSDVQIEEIIAFVRTLAQPAFEPKGVLPVATKLEGPVQPIFFSHVIHAGSMQIACQYCHANARRGPAAGVPSVERCMGCHKIVAAQGNPEVQKLQGYWEKQVPIPWIRVFKLPEYVQFTHKAHIQAGVQCQTCHGRIEAMQRVHAITGQNLPNDLLNLTGMNIPPTKLTMGWCVECHRSVNVSGTQAVQSVASLPVPSVSVPPGAEAEKRNAPLECVTCHH